MSLIRILIGVMIGCCLLAGLLAAAIRFPSIAGFLMFGSAGCGIMYVSYHGLRTGVISAKRSRYERQSSPGGYWFYIFFYAVVGLAILGFGVYLLLQPLFGWS